MQVNNFKMNNSNDKKTANLQLVKDTNLMLVFNLIYSHGPISRVELSRMTRLSRTTISSLVEEVISRDMVLEIGAGKTSTSGRKPIMLRINSLGGYVFAIEILPGSLKCFTYDICCNEIGGNEFEVVDFRNIGNQIVRIIENFIKEYNIEEEKIHGIILGIPGLIDHEKHKVVTSTIIEELDINNDFYEEIKQRFKKVPVLLENESSLYAYAEKEFGIQGSINNLVFIDINAGIGAGIILNGELFRGAHGLAGEIGHVTIDINAPRCKCGNLGCLEVQASIPAIVNRMINEIESGQKTVIKSMIKGDINKIDIDMIKQALLLKDEFILEMVDDIANKLAIGINNIINMYDPEAIVLGGEIVKIGDELLTKLKQKLSNIELKPNINMIEIRYSSIRRNPVTLGGARYMIDVILRTPGLNKSNTYKFNG